MIKFLMLSSYDDLLDHTSHQGFEINDTTRQRAIGHVKADIASQTHYYSIDYNNRIDVAYQQADAIDFDSVAFALNDDALSLRVTRKVECLI